MIIEILRLGHRLPRDCRISTHCALVARTFGASAMYYSGMHDSSLEEAVNKIVDKFGGPFKIEHVKNDQKFAASKKKEGFIVVHLTVYGLDFSNECKKIKKEAGNSGKILVVIGGEKVEGFFYSESNYNVAVGHQPHSEVAALALVLNEIHGEKKDFENVKILISGEERGKNIKNLVKK